MKKIYLLLLFVFISVISKSQNYDIILQNKNMTEYTDGSLDISVYTFEANMPVSVRKEQMISTKLMDKYGVKSVEYNTDNKSFKITALKEIQLKDLSVVLKQVNVLLDFESTLDSDITKAEYHINNK